MHPLVAAVEESDDPAYVLSPALRILHTNRGAPTLYRKFKMIAYPLDGPRLLVVNSLVLETPHAGDDRAADARYRAGGVVRMCAHGRRTYNPTTDGWDWVSAHVAAVPSAASHGICPPCLEFHRPVTEREATA